MLIHNNEFTQYYTPSEEFTTSSGCFINSIGRIVFVFTMFSPVNNISGGTHTIFKGLPKPMIGDNSANLILEAVTDPVYISSSTYDTRKMICQIELSKNSGDLFMNYRYAYSGVNYYATFSYIKTKY